MSFARSTLKTSSLTQPCTHRRTQSFRSCFNYHKKFRERHQRCPCLNHSFRYSRLSKVMLFQPHDLVMCNSLMFPECKTFLYNSQQILRYSLKYYLVTKRGVRPQSSYWEVWKTDLDLEVKSFNTAVTYILTPHTYHFLRILLQRSHWPSRKSVPGVFQYCLFRNLYSNVYANFIPLWFLWKSITDFFF